MARNPQAILVAFNRFGFGARANAPDDLAHASTDPRGFVKAELNGGSAVPLDLPGLSSTPALADAVFAYQADVKQARGAATPSAATASDATPLEAKALREPPALDGNAMDGSARSSTMAAVESAAGHAAGVPPQATPSDAAKPPLNVIQRTYHAEALARLRRAMTVECGFAERLVAFWSNHFCISAGKGELARIWAGAFEREAIRPHVLGRFADMLKAVEQHPAMLFFLDNQQSFGPDSRAGQNRKRGLNENLAREIMELHTLGVGGGYSQADVTALARIITGWSFAGRQGLNGQPGTFLFNDHAHQPGAQLLLGKTYPDDGLAQGEAALQDIARHPSTANFIASKFARHFVADDPPPALVGRLREVFHSSDGDLRALTLALLDSDQAWQAPLSKLRSPYEFLVASGRLLGPMPEDAAPLLGALNLLGQPLWSPAGPNGFPDSNAAWAAPEGIKLRLDIAARIAARDTEASDPRQLLDVVAADAASAETRQAIARAQTRQQALALLLMSPEFQRR